MNKFLVFAGMGFELVGIVVAADFLSKRIDETYKTNGVALIALLVGGLIGWLLQIIFLLQKIDKEEQDSDSKK